MKKKIPFSCLCRNHSIKHQLDLFSWRLTITWNDDRATSLIAKRFGLSPDHASTVARLAGIGGSRHES